MRTLKIFISLILCLHSLISCINYETKSEKLLRLQKELLVNRPVLKEFILDSERPDLYNEDVYKTKSSVAGFQGEIEISFSNDRIIKIIKFTSDYIPSKTIKIDEVKELIVKKYNLQYSLVNQKSEETEIRGKRSFYDDFFDNNYSGPSCTAQWIKDSTLYQLFTHTYDRLIASEYTLKKYEREEKKLLKEGKIRNYSDIQDFKQKVHGLTHEMSTSFILKISNNNFAKRLEAERKKNIEESRVNYERNQIEAKHQKEKELLKDF